MGGGEVYTLSSAVDRPNDITNRGWCINIRAPCWVRSDAAGHLVRGWCKSSRAGFIPNPCGSIRPRMCPSYSALEFSTICLYSEVVFRVFVDLEIVRDGRESFPALGSRFWAQRLGLLRGLGGPPNLIMQKSNIYICILYFYSQPNVSRTRCGSTKRTSTAVRPAQGMMRSPHEGTRL